MTRTNQAEIYQKEWCKELIDRLGKLKDIESRWEILDIKFDKAGIGGPRNKLVASYGDITTGVQADTMTDEEAEYIDKGYEIKTLHAAINGLEDMVRAIIKLKYVEKVNNWHITELYIPKHFFDKKGRPLYISDSTLKRKKRNGLIQMGKNLGYKIN